MSTRVVNARRRGFSLVELVVVIGIIILLMALVTGVSITLSRNADINDTQNTMRILDQALEEWQQQSDRTLTFGSEGNPFSSSTYDLHAETPHVYLISELLLVITRNASVKSIVSQIKPDYLVQYDTSKPAPRWVQVQDPQDPDANARTVGSIFSSNDFYGDGSQEVDGMLTVLDAWGTPFRVVHPGRAWSDAAPFLDPAGAKDKDGTVQLNFGSPNWPLGVERAYGNAVNRRVGFISAGPDGRFGSRWGCGGFNNNPESQCANILDNLTSYPTEQPR